MANHVLIDGVERVGTLIFNTRGTAKTSSVVIDGEPCGFATVGITTGSAGASPPGTLVTDTSGIIYDRAGYKYALAGPPPTQIKIAPPGTYNFVVAPGSKGVMLLFWDGLTVNQQIVGGDFWTQPWDGSDGVLLKAPPAGFVAPVSSLSAPPVLKYATPYFEDDFKSLSLGSTTSLTAWPPANFPENWLPLLQNGWPGNKPPQDLSCYFEPANHEAECYDPAALQLMPGGGVSLVATRGKSNPAGQPWMSGCLTQNRKFGLAGGYFETVASLPQLAGMFPAFWMLPTAGDWSWEIDFFEAVAKDASNNFSPKMLHYGEINANGTASTAQWWGAPDTASLHKFGGLWLPGKSISYFFDDVQTGQLACPGNATADSPGYMLINLAIGAAGSWAGPPDASVSTMAMNVKRATSYRLGTWGAGTIPLTPPVS